MSERENGESDVSETERKERGRLKRAGERRKNIASERRERDRRNGKWGETKEKKDIEQ